MSDKTGMYFDMHPDTCTPFINFRVPYFDEAIALCKKAAKVRPDMRYVGWDVGITPTGPVLVEGNNLPAYDGQIYHQQENPGTGLRPLVPLFRVTFSPKSQFKKPPLSPASPQFLPAGTEQSGSEWT